MTRPYEYVVQRVTGTNDGDTSRFDLRATPDLLWSVTARLYGYDTPESRRTRCGTCRLYASAYELRMAIAALDWTKRFLSGEGQLWARVEEKTDSFGRQLTTVWHEVDDVRTSLGESLVDAGLASVWPTRWHEVHDPHRDRS